MKYLVLGIVWLSLSGCLVGELLVAGMEGYAEGAGQGYTDTKCQNRSWTINDYETNTYRYCTQDIYCNVTCI